MINTLTADQNQIDAWKEAMQQQGGFSAYQGSLSGGGSGGIGASPPPADPEKDTLRRENEMLRQRLAFEYSAADELRNVGNVIREFWPDARDQDYTYSGMLRMLLKRERECAPAHEPRKEPKWPAASWRWGNRR